MYEIVIGRSESDKKKLGLKGTIFLGKHYVKMGAVTSLSNQVYIDVAQPHVILLTGKRGSGKSHTLAVIAEEMSKLPEGIRERIGVLIFDTMGIFWTAKYPNTKDEDLLTEWRIKPESFDVTIYTPEGYFEEQKNNGIPVDKSFTINPTELTAEEWCNVFNVNIFDPIGITIERALESLEGKDYDIRNIINQIMEDDSISEDIKLATENRFKAAKQWRIFNKESTPDRKSVV